MGHHALLAGASGLVGGALLDLLLADARVERVTSVGRRPLDRTHPKLTQRTVDFAALDLRDLAGVTQAYCTLGTTIKKAGSEAAFRAVDHDAVMAFATAAKALGVGHLSVVSALGASATSMSFYNRVKGETERDLQALSLPSLAILQPSLLLGDRTESRTGEALAIGLSRALGPLLKPFASRPIEYTTVARAMVTLAFEARPGAHVVLSGDLHALAR